MESDAYPFTPKTYPNDKGDTIDIGPLPAARNGQLAASVDCLDGSIPLCKAQWKFPQFGQSSSKASIARTINAEQDAEGEMTTFDEREKGYEQQFAHDEELRFKAIARRNKLLGLWAAAKLGMTGPSADAYSKDVVMAEFEAGGDEDVFRKLRKDFDAKSVALSDQEIRKAMQDLLGQAVQQIKGGK